MKNLFLLLTFILFCGNAEAQCDGQIFLSDQEAVDNFAFFNACAVIDGDLIIGSATGVFTDITDLSGLSGLQIVTGNLWVLHTELANLDGLENLTTVNGMLAICDNYSLTDITAVENLQSIGGTLMLTYDGILEACCSVPILAEVTEGPIIIENNGPGCNDLDEIASTCNTDGSPLCEFASTIEAIAPLENFYTCPDGSGLTIITPPASSLPDVSIVITINDTIIEINEDGSLDPLLIQEGDQVCYAAFAYDLESINDILNSAQDLCPALDEFFSGLAPCGPIDDLISGSNDGIPGVNELEEAFFFASSFVGEINTIEQAQNALNVLNDNIAVLDWAICYAVSQPVCIEVGGCDSVCEEDQQIDNLSEIMEGVYCYFDNISEVVEIPNSTFPNVGVFIYDPDSEISSLIEVNNVSCVYEEVFQDFPVGSEFCFKPFAIDLAATQEIVDEAIASYPQDGTYNFLLEYASYAGGLSSICDFYGFIDVSGINPSPDLELGPGIDSLNVLGGDLWGNICYVYGEPFCITTTEDCSTSIICEEGTIEPIAIIEPTECIDLSNFDGYDLELPTSNYPDVRVLTQIRDEIIDFGDYEGNVGSDFYGEEEEICYAGIAVDFESYFQVLNQMSDYYCDGDDILYLIFGMENACADVAFYLTDYSPSNFDFFEIVALLESLGFLSPTLNSWSIEEVINALDAFNSFNDDYDWGDICYTATETICLTVENCNPYMPCLEDIGLEDLMISTPGNCIGPDNFNEIEVMLLSSEPAYPRTLLTTINDEITFVNEQPWLESTNELQIGDEVCYYSIDVDVDLLALTVSIFNTYPNCIPFSVPFDNIDCETVNLLDTEPIGPGESLLLTFINAMGLSTTTVDDLLQSINTINSESLLSDAYICSYLSQPICITIEDCVAPILGCTDPNSCNYEAIANEDNGSCAGVGDACSDGDDATINDVFNDICDCVGETAFLGCVDPLACNYNPQANEEDGSCAYPLVGCTCEDVNGCTNPEATNYDASATCDDGSCIIIGTGEAAINTQFVYNQDSCNSGYYCVNLQIQGINGAEYIGNSSVRFSYDPNVLQFSGSSALGVTIGTYTSINFDDDQTTLNPECEAANGGQGFTPYSAHAFDGLIAGDVLITLILQSPTIGTFVSACPPINNEWTDVATICFDVLDSEMNPALTFTGVENTSPPDNTSDTNFNPDTNNPADKYDNGTFIDLNTPENELPPCGGFLLKAFLEGPYNEETNSMTTKLYEQGLLPLSHPYNQAPWNFEEAYAVESYEEFPQNAVDWVLVELRQGTPNQGGTMIQGTTPMFTKAAILLSNGIIVEADGSPLTFPDLIEGDKYYIAIRHRNHLDVLSVTPVIVSSDMEYDFSTHIDKAFGNQQLKNINGISVLHSGDLIGEGVIQSTDYDCWAAQPAALNVYSPNDANLDGVVQVTDFEEWFSNRSKIGCVEICY